MAHKPTKREVRRAIVTIKLLLHEDSQLKRKPRGRYGPRGLLWPENRDALSLAVEALDEIALLKLVG